MQPATSMARLWGTLLPAIGITACSLGMMLFLGGSGGEGTAIDGHDRRLEPAPAVGLLVTPVEHLRGGGMGVGSAAHQVQNGADRTRSVRNAPSAKERGGDLQLGRLLVDLGARLSAHVAAGLFSLPDGDRDPACGGLNVAKARAPSAPLVTRRPTDHAVVHLDPR